MIHIKTTSTPIALAIHVAELTPKLEKTIKASSISKYIKVFLLSKLKDILQGEPSQLMDIHNELKKLTIKRNEKTTKKNLRHIFRYDLFANKKQEYNAYNLAENLGLNVCPYCNREHTVTINSKKVEGQLTRPDFDHFLPQSQFPLLALSFYNLIPSCKTCNSTFKGSKDVKALTHLHPYIDNFLNQIEFDYKEITVNGKADIEIIIKPIKASIDKSRIDNTLDLFKIQDVYNGHKYIVKDLLDKKKEINGDYLEILANHTYSRLNTSKERLYYFAFGTYLDEEDFYKRPFSKLLYDIIKKEEMLEHLSKLQ